MASYVQFGVDADPALTLFSNPTQDVLNKVKAAIKADILEGPVHLNQTLRFVIKTALWKSLKFKDMEKVAAALDLTKPFLVVPERVVKAYQKLRYLASDGIVGDMTAAQLVKDGQTVLAAIPAAAAPAVPPLPGQPPATPLDAYKEFQKMLLMPPFKVGKLTKQPATGYQQTPPEPTGTQREYTTVPGRQTMPETYKSGGSGTTGGTSRLAVRQTKPIRVRASFSMPSLITSIVGSIAAIYVFKGIQQYGPGLQKAFLKARAKSRRVW